MNAFLANVVGFLNGLLAILLIASGMIAGVAVTSNLVGLAPGPLTGKAFGLLLGGLLGLLTAAVVCGLIAILLNIRDELREIRNVLGRRSELAFERREPTFDRT